MVTEKSCNLSEQISLKNKEVKPVKPIQNNIYQSNAYRKELSLLHFDDEPRVEEKHQLKDQQSYIYVFLVYLTFNISR